MLDLICMLKTDGTVVGGPLLRDCSCSVSLFWGIRLIRERVELPHFSGLSLGSLKLCLAAC